MSKVSYSPEKGSCALLTAHLRQWEHPPSRLKDITLSLKTLGKVVDGREREMFSEPWLWCLPVAAQLHGALNHPGMYIPGKKSHRFHSFPEENGENPTSNAASAALLNEDCYGESLGLLDT